MWPPFHFPVKAGDESNLRVLGLKVYRLDGGKAISGFVHARQGPSQARRVVGNQAAAANSHSREQRKQLRLDVATGRGEQGGIESVFGATQPADRREHRTVPGVGVVQNGQIGAQGRRAQFRFLDRDNRGDPFRQECSACPDAGAQVPADVRTF